MAISIAVETKCCCFKFARVQKIAPYLDLIVGIAIVAIGLLSMYGVVGINAMGTWSLIGAGSTYAGLALFKILAKKISWRPCC